MGYRHSARYILHEDGALLIDSLFEPIGELPPIPRLGLILGVAGEYGRFTWLGRGPFESYPDRKAAAAVGLYSGLVEEQYQEYLRPQENGNKEDVRWAALTNRQGEGIMFQAIDNLAVGVQKFTSQQLFDARHQNGEGAKLHPLVPRDDIVVCLDAHQMGLGGASCGPPPLEKYRVPQGPVRFRLVLRPIQQGDDLRQLGRIPVAGLAEGATSWHG